ncbi:glycosyltransferase [Elstera litoralis]|uniref:glycosyltransferase n=1 Tax=Elstera litoralis TaxID=552518 RepID=UPI000ABD3E42
MRLLQAMAGAKHGGAEAFFERLAIAFAEAGVQQQVVIRPDAARESRLRVGGVALSTLPFGGFFDLTTRRGLARLAQDADLLLTWMNRATLFARPTPRTRLVARLGGYYDLKYYRRCEYLVANTEDICRWLREQGFPPDRVTYLPNFVEPQAAALLPRESLTDRDGPLLLMLGRLHANKAFDVALAALAEIPGATLLIAGWGPSRKSFLRNRND